MIKTLIDDVSSVSVEFISKIFCKWKSEIKYKAKQLSLNQDLNLALTSVYKSDIIRTVFTEEALILCLYAATERYEPFMVTLACQALFSSKDFEHRQYIEKLLEKAKSFHINQGNQPQAEQMQTLQAFYEIISGFNIDENTDYLIEMTGNSDDKVRRTAQELLAVLLWDFNYIFVSDEPPYTSKESIKEVLKNSKLLSPATVDNDCFLSEKPILLAAEQILMGNEKLLESMVKHLSRKNDWSKESLILMEAYLRQKGRYNLLIDSFKRLSEKGVFNASIRLGNLYADKEQPPIPVYQNALYFYTNAAMQATDRNEMTEALGYVIKENKECGYIRDALFYTFYLGEWLKESGDYENWEKRLEKEDLTDILNIERLKTDTKTTAQRAFDEENYAAAFKEAFLYNYINEDADCLMIMADIISKGYFLPPPQNMLANIVTKLHDKYGITLDAYGDILAQNGRYDEAAEIYFNKGTAYAFSKLSELMYDKKTSFKDDFLCNVYAYLYAEMAGGEETKHNSRKIFDATRSYAEVYPLCYDVKESSLLPIQEWNIDGIISLAEKGNIPATVKVAEYHISKNDKNSAFTYLTKAVNLNHITESVLSLWVECGIGAGIDYNEMIKHFDALLSMENIIITRAYLVYVKNVIGSLGKKETRNLAKKALMYAKQGKNKGDSFCSEMYSELKNYLSIYMRILIALFKL